MSYDLTKFKHGLEELNITLTDEQVEQFLQYYEMLVEKNKVMNLTAITEEDAEVTHTFEGYIIVLIAALFGSLVALGFWNVLGA